MPRPNKEKRVCRLPKCQKFAPSLSDSREAGQIVISMTVEEYECIRLIDYAGCNQEACARYMGTSRATVQALYTNARKKLARFLVEAAVLKIGGGNFVVGLSAAEDSQGYLNNRMDQKGDIHMKIAVTYQDGEIFQHFGHTEQFKVYQVEEGKVVSSEVVGTDGFGHGALAGFLQERGVEVLICGGIGGGARNALAEAGIKLYPGACGDADAQVNSFLAGNLNYNPDTMCNHHGHGHGEGSCHHHEGGSCGDRHHHREGNCGGHYGHDGGSCRNH